MPPPKPRKHHGEGGTGEEEQGGLGTESETVSGTESSSEGGSGTGGDEGKCRAPLPTQFASNLENGHGCKKIAEAFNNCNVNICQEVTVRENCLCKQSQIFSNALVNSCYLFLNEQNSPAAGQVELYLGLCGV